MVFNSLNSFKIYNETNEPLSDELKYIRKIIRKTLRYEKVKNSTLNIIIESDNKIKEINSLYRKIDKPTDVISFALLDSGEEFYSKKTVLGDIYISIDTAKRQAKEYNHSLVRELCFLTVHGILHLLGYDHMNIEDEKVMFKEQELILDGQRYSSLQKK